MEQPMSPAFKAYPTVIQAVINIENHQSRMRAKAEGKAQVCTSSVKRITW
jgi:hypothetical protein